MYIWWHSAFLHTPIYLSQKITSDNDHFTNNVLMCQLKLPDLSISILKHCTYSSTNALISCLFEALNIFKACQTIFLHILHRLINISNIKSWYKAPKYLQNCVFPLFGHLEILRANRKSVIYHQALVGFSPKFSLGFA
jgi:hypothetical protein